jgi:hypothetical protein
LKILGWNDVDLRARKKRFDADIDGQATFNHCLDLAFDESVALEDFDNLIPVLLVGRLLLRENDHALVVFESDEQDFDFFPNLYVLRGRRTRSAR